MELCSCFSWQGKDKVEWLTRSAVCQFPEKKDESFSLSYVKTREYKMQERKPLCTLYCWPRLLDSFMNKKWVNVNARNFIQYWPPSSSLRLGSLAIENRLKCLLLWYCRETVHCQRQVRRNTKLNSRNSLSFRGNRAFLPKLRTAWTFTDQ